MHQHYSVLKESITTVEVLFLRGGLIILDRIAVFHVNSVNTPELPPMPVTPTLKFVPGQIFGSVEKISRISCPQKLLIQITAF